MGEASARRRNSSTIDAALRGHVVPADVQALHKQVGALLDQGPARFLVIDTAAVTTFSPDVRMPGVPFLEDCRKRGVQLLIGVAPSTLVRMMGSAIALAAGLRIKLVATQAEADELIEKTARAA